MRPDRFAPSWLTARPIAHRGLHDWPKGVVENTLGACKAAVDYGYAIECDLQISRDGEAMLFHDSTLDRVMQATGLVKDFSRGELQRMAFRHSSEAIPTLTQLLDLVAGQVPLVIELKPQWDGDYALTGRSLEVLQNYTGPYCLMSFDPGVVTELKRLSPSTTRGFISDRGHDPFYNLLPVSLRNDLRTLHCLERMQPHFLSMDIEELPWAPIAHLREFGMPIITWTIRSPQQAAIAMRYSDQITFEGFRA